MDNSKPRESALTPLALGAVAMTAGLTAYLVSPARRSVSARQRQALIDYLHDHLTGSDAAIQVVQRLGSTHPSTDDRTLFRRLAQEFEDERAVVRTILTQLGASGRSMKRAAGRASGTALAMTAGGESGDLSLLRTLEALAIGVQGKRILWRGLQKLHTVHLTFDAMAFAELEATAVRQWEAIEERRLSLIVPTFSRAGVNA